MTDAPTTNPLQAAQALVAHLQSSAAALDPAALKGQLDQLGELLTQTAERGGGADADELRAQLDKTVQDTASFASMMVHEIRKPMTSIRGYADMLAKPGMIGPMNDMQQQMINTVRTNVIRMEGLVADISDISKLNSGKIRLDSKMTTFGQIIMDVQKQTEGLSAESGHTVAWEVPQGLPILTVDAKQLAKVIVNLLRNALQYTPNEKTDMSALSQTDADALLAGMQNKGGAQITVRAERLDGNILWVGVTDNGIGMRPDELARLGELFYRADNPLVTAQRGYGLGVPIAMGFLRLMDSALDVRSTPDAGSEFSFKLAGMG